MGKKAVAKKKDNNGKAVLAVLLLIVAGTVMFFAAKPGSKPADGASAVQPSGGSSGDLVINKSEVTETAKFYPVKADGISMEIMAVKAEDGTVRTAFNTCQVCFDSGRGYYKQEGTTLVCQNCGNVFSINDIEKVKNGCNPVPIVAENKTEDNDKITISQDTIASGKDLFTNWKR